MSVQDIDKMALEALLTGTHGAPFSLLGKHPVAGGNIIIRALRPNAQTLTLIDDTSGARSAMPKRDERGLFEVTVPGKVETFAYHFEETRANGRTVEFFDPYIFEPLLTDFDIYLLGEGQHLFSYQKLGAHRRTVGTVEGVNFAVWAPNAQRVSVIGDFNDWHDLAHPMQRREISGIWELFIPGVDEGTIYRYAMLSHHRAYYAQKTDPYGFYTERRPKSASIVFDIDRYTWHDDEWMQNRDSSNPLTQPIAIYEVHLGSWKRKPDGSWLSYRELAHEMVEYVKTMGFTHIELMPVAEHPLDASWGYQVTGYYAPTSRYGDPLDFKYFVDYCHANGIGVILDWVPAHFPKDGHALSYFDGTHLYSHEDPRQGEHPDWGTYIFNYGRNEVRNFLISNALYWLKEYHIDGLRVDAVSSMLYLNFSREEGQWIPNRYGSNENIEAIDFMRRTNEIVYEHFPGVMMIAEESTAWAMVSRPTYLGGLGFLLKWNMGWMHDTLKYMSLDPIYRRYHHNQITFSLLYAFNENFILSLSHDEVVHLKGSLLNKMSGYGLQRFDSLRLLFGYQYTHPGKKLNFMGQELGQWREWDETREIDWYLLQYEPHQHMQNWLRDLNTLYRQEAALYEVDFEWQGFRWIEANDGDNSVISYLRYAKNNADFLVVVCNFTPTTRHHYRIGVPEAGYYREILNSDSAFYGGSNTGNGGGISSEASESHGLPYSLNLTLPPLGIVVFKLQKGG
jgi:1,4-alpha-glucan branching enzyme